MRSLEFSRISMALLGTLLVGCPVVGGEAVVGPAPVADYYCPDEPVTGTLKLVGAETMGQLAALWSHRFQQIHPQVQIQIECQGSETALPSLTKDVTSIGMISRELTDAERQQFEGQLGLRLVDIDVGSDALAVVVHSQNPVPLFSREQGSRLLARPKDGAAATWKDLGAEGDWATVPISMHGYTDRSGTRTFLRRFLLGNAGGRAVHQHESHAALLEAVAADRGGVGIVSLSRVRPDRVRLVPVLGTDGQPVSITDETAITDGRYPLVRRLTLLVPVSGPALREPLRREFVKYVLSREGQADVAKDGFLPLSRDDLLLQEDRLGWHAEK